MVWIFLLTYTRQLVEWIRLSSGKIPSPSFTKKLKEKEEMEAREEETASENLQLGKR